MHAFLLQEMMHYINLRRKMFPCTFQLLMCMEVHTSKSTLTFPLNQKAPNTDSVLVDHRLGH